MRVKRERERDTIRRTPLWSHAAPPLRSNRPKRSTRLRIENTYANVFLLRLLPASMQGSSCHPPVRRLYVVWHMRRQPKRKSVIVLKQPKEELLLSFPPTRGSKSKWSMLGRQADFDAGGFLSLSLSLLFGATWTFTRLVVAMGSHEHSCI